jgi:hypothetical protein
MQIADINFIQIADILLMVSKLVFTGILGHFFPGVQKVVGLPDTTSSIQQLYSSTLSLATH